MHELFFYFILLSVGLVLGSFMNVLIYRIPRDKSIVKPPSSCPKCGNLIKWYSNIPILSYVYQKGKCASCGAKISIRYPLVEFFTGFLFVLVGVKYGQSYLSIKYCIFIFLLLAAAFTDVDTRLDPKFDCGYIPDHYTVGGTLIGYIISLTFGEVVFFSSLAGSGAGVFSILIVGYLFRLIRKMDGIGDGDALLLGMIGSFLGEGSIFFVIMCSSLIGSIIGLTVVFVTKNRNYAFPFGPMISFAAIVYIFLGPEKIYSFLFS